MVVEEPINKKSKFFYKEEKIRITDILTIENDDEEQNLETYALLNSDDKLNDAKIHCNVNHNKANEEVGYILFNSI